uniref:Haemolymph juvenile hormone binding protein n=1 Tax=Anopheles atroparvus TaxID=41427 RepID=A0AAG5CXW9_ANOAO
MVRSGSMARRDSNGGHTAKRGSLLVTRFCPNMGIGMVLLLAAVGLFHASQAKEIAVRNKDVPQYQEKPEWLRVCRRANPNEDDCFRKMFEGTFPYIAKGIPEIGVQPFDPLRIESIQVSRGSGGLTLSGGFKKLSIKGPSNTTVRQAFLDFDKKALGFELEIPKLRIDASYNLKGNVLLLPLVGDGDVTMTLKNVKTTVVTKFSVRPLPEVSKGHPSSRTPGTRAPPANRTLLSSHRTGRYLYRRDASDLPRWWHAHSSGQPVPRESGARGLPEPVPQPERERSHSRAAVRSRARAGRHLHRALERAVQQAAAQALDRVNKRARQGRTADRVRSTPL